MPLFIKGCVPCKLLRELYAQSKGNAQWRHAHQILRKAHWGKRPMLQTKVDPKMIDEQIKELVEHEDSVIIKRALEAGGYTWGTSLYGVLHRKTTDRRVYRRIEVWSNRVLDSKRIVQLHTAFTNAPPIFVYSIWRYNADTDDLKLAGGWERDET